MSTSSAVSMQKQCWICFLTEDDVPGALDNANDSIEASQSNVLALRRDTDEQQDQQDLWVKPCRCKGTSKWVHQSCLQRWIDEKQKSNSSQPVQCAQCKAEYVLVFPRSGPLVVVLEGYDRLLYGMSPFAAATALLGSVYCSACVYGALTVCQVMGPEEGKNVIENADPLMLIIGLPSIPVMLILGKLIRWEDSLLRCWVQSKTRFTFMRHIFGSPPECPRESAEKILIGRDTFADPVAATRMFCGALVLPTAAMLVGKYFFERVGSNLHRTLLGGLTFIAIKGFVRIYLRQQQYIRHSQRKVCDYDSVQHQQQPKLKVTETGPPAAGARVAPVAAAGHRGALPVYAIVDHRQLEEHEDVDPISGVPTAPVLAAQRAAAAAAAATVAASSNGTNEQN